MPTRSEVADLLAEATCREKPAIDDRFWSRTRNADSLVTLLRGSVTHHMGWRGAREDVTLRATRELLRSAEPEQMRRPKQVKRQTWQLGRPPFHLVYARMIRSAPSDQDVCRTGLASSERIGDGLNPLTVR